MSCTRTSPFVVLREATFEEWVAERLQERGYVPDTPCDPSEALFYECQWIDAQTIIYCLS
jgi:hypothetical protein